MLSKHWDVMHAFLLSHQFQHPSRGLNRQQRNKFSEETESSSCFWIGLIHLSLLPRWVKLGLLRWWCAGFDGVVLVVLFRKLIVLITYCLIMIRKSMWLVLVTPSHCNLWGIISAHCFSSQKCRCDQDQVWKYWFWSRFLQITLSVIIHCGLELTSGSEREHDQRQ